MPIVYWGSGPKQGPKALFVYNPIAGASRNYPREWDWLTDRLRNAGYELGEYLTERPGDATKAATLALADGCRLVIVAGGDGTINEALQAIAGTEITLGIIPAGSTNVLAAELAIPTDFEQALEVILAGNERRMDLGKCNGRYFSMMTGIGFDAQMTKDLIPEIKKRIGNVAFVDAWIRAFFTHRARRMVITLDKGLPTQRKLRRLAFMLVASNTSLYGGTVLKINEKADISDGLLDICILRSRRWYDVIRHFLGTVTGTHRQFDDIEFCQARKLTIKASSPVPYQLDGDHAGKTPVSIEIAPGALKVFVP